MCLWGYGRGSSVETKSRGHFPFRIMEPYDVIVNQPVVIDNVSARSPSPVASRRRAMCQASVSASTGNCRSKGHETLLPHVALICRLNFNIYSEARFLAINVVRNYYRSPSTVDDDGDMQMQRSHYI